MAVWGIDIGHSALKAVKLNRTKEGLEIAQVAYIPIDGGKGDEDRSQNVREAVKQFLDRHQVGKDRVVVSLPGHHAFSRFIQLPPVDPKRFDEMVVLEARQQIPFPIEEVMWGYHRVEPETEGDEIEVGLFAARRELLLGFLSELKENGVAPDQVTIAPLAIYNFVAHNMDISEETVILDIGAKHTDLIAIKGNRFFIRNLRVAGADITEAVSSRFKVPTHEAEKLKRSADKSKKPEKIYSSMNGVLRDIANEVERSINFFNSTGAELKPKQLVLLGDAAKLRNIQPVLQKELKMKTKRLRELKKDRFFVGENVDFEILSSHILGFGVALGLGVQGVSSAATNLNLLPQEDQIASELKRKVVWAAATAVLCWLVVGMSYLYWTGVLSEMDSATKSIKQTAKALQRHKDAEGQMKHDDVEAKATKYREMLNDRLMPLQLLSKLNQVMPQSNGVIPTIETEKRSSTSPVEQQDFINRERPAKLKEKFWILDFKISATDNADAVLKDKQARAANGGEEGVPPVKLQKGLSVNLLVCRQFPEGLDQTVVQKEIETTVTSKLKEIFKEGPFFIRAPGIPRKVGEPNLELGSGKTIFALDINATEQPANEQLRCRVYPVSFEVGYQPIPEPKEEAEEDNGE